jgi:hypothetical protein
MSHCPVFALRRIGCRFRNRVLRLQSARSMPLAERDLSLKISVEREGRKR